MVPRLTHRLVATDLDGTLLHTDGTVTARSRAALSAVEDLGVTVVFVTGRPIRWLLDLEEHVGPHGLAICSNGGIVYDVPAGVIRSVRTIPVEVGLRVGALLCEHLGIAPGQVVAFGDMPNDIAMLTWAETSYAMANAHPSVLELVERTAPVNDDDGVAVVLEELFGL